MAYAMSRLVPVFLCMALAVVHVDSARLLLLAGKDPVGMTAETSATTDDFGAQGRPALDSAEDAFVHNKDVVTTDETTAEFAALDFDSTKRDLTEGFADAGILWENTQGTVGSGKYDYRHDATKRDEAYSADSDEGASQFTLARANQQFGSGESGYPRFPADEPQRLDFEDLDNNP